MLGLCITVSSVPSLLLSLRISADDLAVVNASRTILFDVHSRIGLNFGILFAWCAINTALFPLCCYFMRWKTMREKKEEAQGKNE
jgi:Protein of unknown function (DUF3533)